MNWILYAVIGHALGGAIIMTFAVNGWASPGTVVTAIVALWAIMIFVGGIIKGYRGEQS